MKPISGKNVILTGASRGLGVYIAEHLARAGANIALAARSENALADTQNRLSPYPVKTGIYPVDLTDAAARQSLLDRVKADFGQVDMLVNNAGIEWLSSYTALPPDKIEKMIQTNLIAPMLLTRMVLPEMLARKSGHIVNMASMGGKKGSPYSATYAATKAGLIHFTSSIRAECHKTGVSASVICPGFVSESGMFAVYNKRAPKIAGESSPEAVAKAVIRAIEKDKFEILINPGPVRLMMIIEAIHPGIMTWVLRAFGLHDFYRQQAMENETQHAQS